MSAEMPSAGSPTQAPPVAPPPAYPGYAPYGLPSPFAGERQKQVDRTKTGLLLLLIGGLLSWIPVISLIGDLLLLIGAILVIIGRRAFGAAHSRNVIVALLLYIFAFIGVVALAVVLAFSIAAAIRTSSTDPTGSANAIANALNSFLIGAIVVGAIDGIASVLFTYALQQRIGKAVLWAAFVAGVAISIAVFAIVSSAFASAIAQATSGGTFNRAPLDALRNQISGLGLLSAIPALLFSAATYLAWSRVNRGEIPPPLAMPGIPAMGIPPMGPSPPM